MALQGIRVVDVSIARAGPTAVRQLADWGASVIRVEAPGGRDGWTGRHDGADYQNLHRNKRAMTLNLKSARGLDVFRRLVERADVLVENFRPPVKARLGIDYPTLSQVNPKLVYGSISGFGQTGPYADKGAVDQIIQGLGGVMSVTGAKGGDPTRAGIAIADMAAGYQLALGLLVALYERRDSGMGQWVQVSLLESMISFLDFQAAKWTVDGVIAEPEGNNHPSAAPMGMFRTADGFLNVAASSERLWRAFCDATGSGWLLYDPEFSTSQQRFAHRARLNREVQDVLATRTTAQWRQVLDAVGVPCGPVNAIDEVFADPQVQHLRMAAPVNHPLRGDIRVLRQPVSMSRTPYAEPAPAPLQGQHTEEVLHELGYTDDEVATLRADSAL